MLLLDAPTSAEKRRARCDPGLDVLERGEEDGLEGGTSETTGGAIWVRGLDVVRVAREDAPGFCFSWRAGSPCTFRRFFLLRDEIW